MPPQPLLWTHSRATQSQSSVLIYSSIAAFLSRYRTSLRIHSVSLSLSKFRKRLSKWLATILLALTIGWSVGATSANAVVNPMFAESTTSTVIQQARGGTFSSNSFQNGRQSKHQSTTTSGHSSSSTHSNVKTQQDKVAPLVDLNADPVVQTAIAQQKATLQEWMEQDRQERLNSDGTLSRRARHQLEKKYDQHIAQQELQTRQGLLKLQRNLLQQGIVALDEHMPTYDVEGHRQVVFYQYGLDLASVSQTPHAKERKLHKTHYVESMAHQKAPHRQVIASLVNDLQRKGVDPLDYFIQHSSQMTQQIKGIWQLPHDEAKELAKRYADNLTNYGTIASARITVLNAFEDAWNRVTGRATGRRSLRPPASLAGKKSTKLVKTLPLAVASVGVVIGGGKAVQLYLQRQDEHRQEMLLVELEKIFGPRKPPTSDKRGADSTASKTFPEESIQAVGEQGDAFLDENASKQTGDISQSVVTASSDSLFPTNSLFGRARPTPASLTEGTAGASEKALPISGIGSYLDTLTATGSSTTSGPEEEVITPPANVNKEPTSGVSGGSHGLGSYLDSISKSSGAPSTSSRQSEVPPSPSKSDAVGATTSDSERGMGSYLDSLSSEQAVSNKEPSTPPPVVKIVSSDTGDSVWSLMKQQVGAMRTPKAPAPPPIEASAQKITDTAASSVLPWNQQFGTIIGKEDKSQVSHDASSDPRSSTASPSESVTPGSSAASKSGRAGFSPTSTPWTGTQSASPELTIPSKDLYQQPNSPPPVVDASTEPTRRPSAIQSNEKLLDEEVLRELTKDLVDSDPDADIILDSIVAKQNGQLSPDLFDLAMDPGPRGSFCKYLAKTLTFGGPADHFTHVIQLPGEMPMTWFDKSTATQLLQMEMSQLKRHSSVDEIITLFDLVVRNMLLDLVDVETPSLRGEKNPSAMEGITVILDFLEHAVNLYDSMGELLFGDHWSFETPPSMSTSTAAAHGKWADQLGTVSNASSSSQEPQALKSTQTLASPLPHDDLHKSQSLFDKVRQTYVFEQ